MPQEMFSILIDENGNSISIKDFEKMNREWLVLLLKKYIKKTTYLHKDDRRALLFIADSLLYSFKKCE